MATYVGLIEIPARINEKINNLHSLTEDDVRDAVQWPARPLKSSLVENAEDGRGARLLVEGLTARGVRIRVVLYPVDDQGTWRLATAVPMV